MAPLTTPSHFGHEERGGVRRADLSAAAAIGPSERER
jgi:hypothetical protein